MSDTLPSIPVPAESVESHQRVLLTVKEVLEILAGQRGSDRAARLSDLLRLPTPAGTDLTYDAVLRAIQSSTGADATLPLVTAALAGLAPASGGGTANFLRADGTWASPPTGVSTIEEVVQVACSDQDTAISATGVRAVFRAPYALNTLRVRASLKKATVTGVFSVSITVNATPLFTTNLSFDAASRTTVGATIPPVFALSSISDDAEIAVSVAGVGDGTATGLVVALYGVRP